MPPTFYLDNNYVIVACLDLSGSSNTLRVRRLQVFKLWMFFSTNTLHSYFMGLVLRSFSKHLDESIRLAESIDVIVQGTVYQTDFAIINCIKDHIELHFIT